MIKVERHVNHPTPNDHHAPANEEQKYEEYDERQRMVNTVRLT